MLRSQRTQTPEFELVLVHLTEAWCQLNCSEAIQGLYEWCKSACGRKLPWLKPFFLKAMNRFEEAAAELQSSLTNMLVPQPVGADSVKLQTRPGPLVAAVNQLTAQQITNCYTSLQSWEDASDWLQQFEALKLENASIVGTDPLNYCDKVMMGRETTPELLTWSKQQHLTDLWMTSVAASSQQSLLDGEESARLHQLVKLETSSDWPTSIQPNTMLTLHSQQMDSCSLNSLNLTDLSAVPSGQTQRLSWLLNLVQLASSQSTSASCSQQVMIACSREARHTGNLKLAGSLMTKLSKTQETASSTLSLRIERESAKQIMCLKNSNLALEKMLAVALQPVSSDSDKELNELVARSTLTFDKWLQAEPQLLQSLTDRVNVEEIPSLSALVSQCAEHVMDTSTAPLADKILGSILVKSTIQCPTLAKTWYHFGNWAYKWGRRCLDNTEHSLSTEEVEQIKSLLPPEDHV
ncbi:SMG1 [Bugula neritina]|uniref:SMG1 n=1 Tax=Bugula neritina TaxID=10212 RepID=A0A7J7J2Y1_BUGNE|nr:SMG1 [Bugula neritina]